MVRFTYRTKEDDATMDLTGEQRAVLEPLLPGSSLPISVHEADASPHEIILGEETLKASFVEDKPERLIAGRVCDSDLHSRSR